MIDLISRSKAPAYRGSSKPTQERAGLLAGFWCYLFGAGAPAYRASSTTDTPTPSAQTVPRCWWSFTGSPPYKAPPAPPTTSPDPEVPCDGSSTGSGCPCVPFVEGREIQIYPDE